MTPPELPPRSAVPDGPEDPFEAALFAQELLPEPEGLAERVVAALPRRGRVLSLPALARLAAAVLLVLGTSFAAFGTAPTLAQAEVLEGARDLLPVPAVDLGDLGLSGATETDDVPAGVLGAAGLVLLGGGLILARRLLRRPPSSRENP